jgi:hypothetical protein
MTSRVVRLSLLFSIVLAVACVGAMAGLIRGPGRAAASGGGGIEDGVEGPAPEAGRPAAAAVPASCRDPAGVRKTRRFCREAGPSSRRDLRRLALESPDPLVAGNAIRALCRLGGIEEAEAAALLDDPRPRIRQEAAIALGECAGEEAVGRLALLLEGGDPALRPLAIRSLGRIGTPEARRVLERCLRDPATTRVERAFAGAALASSQGGPGAEGRPEARSDLLLAIPDDPPASAEPETGELPGE